MSAVDTHRIREEIEALHQFFVEWFTGETNNTEDVFAEGLLNSLGDDCTLIQPNGHQSRTADFSNAIRKGYGSNPTFRIAIRKVSIVWQGDEHVLATYEEWQRNAKSSTPPNNGRTATVLFRYNPETAALTWLHIHETWLPVEVMERGPYDF